MNTIIDQQTTENSNFHILSQHFGDILSQHFGDEQNTFHVESVPRFEMDSGDPLFSFEDRMSNPNNSPNKIYLSNNISLINNTKKVDSDIKNVKDLVTDEMEILECSICLEKIHRVDDTKNINISPSTQHHDDLLCQTKLNILNCMKSMNYKNIFSFCKQKMCLYNQSHKKNGDSHSDNKPCITLSCGHIFHNECINEWICYDRRINSIQNYYYPSWYLGQLNREIFSCPNCRKKICLNEIYDNKELQKMYDKKNKLHVYFFLFINLFFYFLKIIVVLYLIYSGS